MLAIVGLPQSAALDAEAPANRPNTRQVDASSLFIAVPFIGGAYKRADLPLGLPLFLSFARLQG